MTAEHSVNTSLAYCVVRRNGAAQRISFAAPVRGGYLQLGTCGEAALSRFDRLGVSNADPISAIESLPILGLRVPSDQQFIRPLYKPPVAPFPNLVPFESLADLREIRARLLPHSKGRRMWSLRGGSTELALAPSALGYVWVQEPVTDVWWPYAVPQFVVDAVFKLSTSSDVIEIVEPAHQLLTALCSANAPEPVQCLVTPCVIDLRIPPLQLHALVEYYVELRESGAMRLGDRDSSNRAWMNDEMISKALLIQYSCYISRLFGVQISPCFSHFVSYLPKSSLPIHLDKRADVFSVSIQLGYFDNRVASNNKWAFYVEDTQSGSTQRFVPELGQAVVFRGGHEKHSRTEIAQGQNSDVLLFHYASK